MSNNDLDKKIEEANKVVKKQREDVEKADKASQKRWVTHCTYPINPTQKINLQTCSQDVLVLVMANLLQNESFHKQACKTLGITTKEYSVDGYTLAQWKEDLETRNARITIKDKKDKLAKLEARLKTIMSEDQKREQEFADILDELAN